MTKTSNIITFIVSFTFWRTSVNIFFRPSGLSLSYMAEPIKPNPSPGPDIQHNPIQIPCCVFWLAGSLAHWLAGWPTGWPTGFRIFNIFFLIQYARMETNAFWKFCDLLRQFSLRTSNGEAIGQA